MQFRRVPSEDQSAYYDITKLELPRGSFGSDKWVQYFWTLDTYDWTSINWQEGPTGCPGTFIEQNDRRHPANEADPKLTAYFGKAQNTIEPDLKPVQTGELSGGLDHELGRSMSLGVRYPHKWLDRTIEDVGVLVPGVGEVFFIANPGEGVAKQILPEPAPALPKAERQYDGVEFRLIKRFSNRWSLNTSYTWSGLFGNDGGLASSDENGRTSPNVERYFDGIYLVMDKHGNPVFGLLPTDRPHYLKVQATYDLPWGTNVGVFSQVSSGGHRMNVNLNVDNLFDQSGILNQSTAPWRDNFTSPASFASAANAPGVLSARDNFLLNTRYEPEAIVALQRAEQDLSGGPSGPALFLPELHADTIAGSCCWLRPHWCSGSSMALAPII
ncbi:MAG: hypothetical protein ABIS06_17105 [Vicinamibacterales bacterium]